ncbi:hypothetical protein E3P77_00973 [Wallemia ichthyophaga]|nr:hypothetical protein E3P77_00973 [Wallemia ichthyophaga]
MSTLHLYNLTLEEPQKINESIVGQFSGSKSQEIAINKSNILEIYKLNLDTIKLELITSYRLFSIIRSIQSFKLTGSKKDFIVLTSDSGNLTVLELVAEKLVVLHCETYGKSGIRRIIPGQFLTCDPKGRSLMIASLDKSKLVYILNRDNHANLTLSSPLEANRSHCITHHISAVDTGYENPQFAALETDYEELDQDPSGEALINSNKLITFYELDLGLNHVLKKWSEPTDPKANMLIQVPGGQSASTDAFDGPSGVLIATVDYLIWYRPQADPHRVPIPKRDHPLDNNSSEGTIIISAVLHKMKGAFFFLLQSEQGDIFKLTMELNGEDVISMRIKYFDTIPPSTSLNILKSGYLFASSEFSNHKLYQFQKLGDDDNELEYSSSSYENNGMPSLENPLPIDSVYFTQRPLDNLVPVDDRQSLAPILDAKVQSIYSGDTPQIYTASGVGSRSTLRVMRHGLDVVEAVSSELPAPPNGIWTLKQTSSDSYHSLIVLSFVNGTLVLGIGESIEEVSDTGMDTSASTLSVDQMGDDTILQVVPHGIRHILGDKRVNQWKAPSGTYVTASTTNSRQVCIALSNGELIYFEMDNAGQLNEFQDRKSMESTVSTISIGEVPEGRQRCPFLALGCDDQTVRIISLDPESTLEVVSVQAVTAQPYSICVAEIFDKSLDKYNPTLFVNIGLMNGVLLRTVLDTVNGSLTDTRTRFLGNKPVSLRRVMVDKQQAVLSLSTRTHLNYAHGDQMYFTPLLYEPLDQVSSFNAELCPDGLIGISDTVLRIFTLPNIGQRMKQDSVGLSYTPRKLLLHPTAPFFLTIESDHRTISKGRQSELLTQKGYNPSAYHHNSLQFGNIRTEAGDWASCVRLIDPVTLNTVNKVELDNNEAAFSAEFVQWIGQEDEVHLVVGTAKDRVMMPQSHKEAYLRVYKVTDDSQLELLHKTDVDDVPYALHAFKGRLLAGVGKALRLYELGKKRLLRKCENKSFAAGVVNLNVIGSRIYVGDMQESVSFAVYKAPENRLLVFADDILPRWTTTATPVDYDTVAGGDKFGNIFVTRVDRSTSDWVDEDESGGGLMHSRGLYHGAPNRSRLLAHFHVGDIITSITRSQLSAGGRDVLVYTGLHGTVGMIVPFASKEDIEFMSTLELHMRQEAPSLVGRNHLGFRSYYVPCKAFVDGDLCELYAGLPVTKQQVIANELDRTSGEFLNYIIVTTASVILANLHRHKGIYCADMEEIIPLLYKQDVLNCQFSKWHSKYRKLSSKAKVVPLSNDFIEYLNSDGIVMPAECNQVEDNDDSDEEQVESPTFPEISNEIRATIEKCGTVIPKLNWSTPIDSRWINPTNTISCTTLDEVYMLLKSSDFIAGELAGQAFEECVDGPPIEIEWELALKQHIEISRNQEFRVFVRDNRIVGICQRDLNFYDFLQDTQTQDQLKKLIEKFWLDHIRDTFSSNNYAVDVYINQHDRVILVDFNVYALRTDSLLFSYEELSELAQSDAFPFKVIDTPADPLAQTGSYYASSAVPKDLIEASQGKNAMEFQQTWNELIDSSRKA